MAMKEITTLRFRIILLLILGAAVVRLLPHEPNFTPVGAMALFAGTYIINKRLALAVPLVIMLLSDVMLEVLHGNGFHRTLFFVYGSFMLITCLGFLLRRRIQRQTIMVASLVGSLIFFFVTNFGVWLMSHGYYPLTWAGLIQCYIAAIPFFKGTVMGDLFYNFILFGSYSLVKWKFPKLVTA
jgi:hypothetical protein